MRIAYLDCFSGISGDMTIAAFLDAGLNFQTLSRELAKLKLKGYTLKKSRVARGEISGTKFDCVPDGSSHGHRSLREIISIIDKSSLSQNVKATAKNIFNAIAAAEMKVHGKANAKDIIFHELGDIDSIIDIVGTAIAVEELGIGAVYSSNVSMGRTIVRSRHGNMPVPSPASLELLKGIPVSITDIEAELVTPTGAGILKTLAKSFGPIPQFEVERIGYGAGSKEISERPNLLRVLIGEASPAMKDGFKEDRVYVIETNIDDMNPQHVGYVVEKLLSAGALDAYITNIQMKKSRPAFKLTAIADTGKLHSVSSVIFSETSAIGLRFYEANRLKLDRKFEKVRTAYGELSVKISRGPDDLVTVTPEHDECVKAARDRKVPLRKVYEAAKAAALTVLLACGLYFGADGFVSADMLVKNDGEEVKGIVLEDYKDRLVMSTVNGEKTVMKADIKELYFDDEEDNLIKLADQAKDKRDYIRALTYYDMAFKANPNSKAAKDGLVFLEGYLFRKEQAQKEDDVRKREDLERQGAIVEIKSPATEDVSSKLVRLRKALGIILEVKDGFPRVETIQSHSPAAEAGVERGDRLIAIWAKLTGYMELREVLDALLDKPSLELKCTIERVVAIPVASYRLIALGPNELIGATFSMEFDGLTVASVREDGPAAASGLKKGDLVTYIDGKSTRYMPLNNAIDMIRNSKESTIDLTIKKEVLIWRRDENG